MVVVNFPHRRQTQLASVSYFLQRFIATFAQTSYLNDVTDDAPSEAFALASGGNILVASLDAEGFI